MKANVDTRSVLDWVVCWETHLYKCHDDSYNRYHRFRRQLVRDFEVLAEYADEAHEIVMTACCKVLDILTVAASRKDFVKFGLHPCCAALGYGQCDEGICVCNDVTQDGSTCGKWFFASRALHKYRRWTKQQNGIVHVAGVVFNSQCPWCSLIFRSRYSAGQHGVVLFGR